MNVDGLLERALASSRAGAHTTALAVVNEALRLAPAAPEVNRALVIVLMHKRDYADAEAALRASGTLTDVLSLQLYAVIAFNLGRPVEAVATAREAVRLAPEDAGTHHQLGCLLRATQSPLRQRRARRRGQNAHACEAAWEEAIRLAPDHLAARAELGERALEFDELRRARSFADACMAIDPAFARGRLLAGRVAWRIGDWDSARDHASWLLANGEVTQPALELLYRTRLPGGPFFRLVLRVAARLNGRPVLTILSLWAAGLVLLILLGTLPLPQLDPLSERLIAAPIGAAVAGLLIWPQWRARQALRPPKLPDSY